MLCTLIHFFLIYTLRSSTILLPSPHHDIKRVRDIEKGIAQLGSRTNSYLGHKSEIEIVINIYRVRERVIKIIIRREARLEFPQESAFVSLPLDPRFLRTEAETTAQTGG